MNRLEQHYNGFIVRLSPEQLECYRQCSCVFYDVSNCSYQNACYSYPYNGDILDGCFKRIPVYGEVTNCCVQGLYCTNCGMWLRTCNCGCPAEDMIWDKLPLVMYKDGNDYTVMGTERICASNIPYSGYQLYQTYGLMYCMPLSEPTSDIYCIAFPLYQDYYYSAYNIGCSIGCYGSNNLVQLSGTQLYTCHCCYPAECYPNCCQCNAYPTAFKLTMMGYGQDWFPLHNFSPDGGYWTYFTGCFSCCYCSAESRYYCKMTVQGQSYNAYDRKYCYYIYETPYVINSQATPVFKTNGSTYWMEGATASDTCCPYLNTICYFINDSYSAPYRISCSTAMAFNWSQWAKSKPDRTVKPELICSVETYLTVDSDDTVGTCCPITNSIAYKGCPVWDKGYYPDSCAACAGKRCFECFPMLNSPICFGGSPVSNVRFNNTQDLLHKGIISTSVDYDTSGYGCNEITEFANCCTDYNQLYVYCEYFQWYQQKFGQYTTCYWSCCNRYAGYITCCYNNVDYCNMYRTLNYCCDNYNDDVCYGTKFAPSMFIGRCCYSCYAFPYSTGTYCVCVYPNCIPINMVHGCCGGNGCLVYSGVINAPWVDKYDEWSKIQYCQMTCSYRGTLLFKIPTGSCFLASCQQAIYFGLCSGSLRDITIQCVNCGLSTYTADINFRIPVKPKKEVLFNCCYYRSYDCTNDTFCETGTWCGRDFYRACTDYSQSYYFCECLCQAYCYWTSHIGCFKGDVPGSCFADLIECILDTYGLSVDCAGLPNGDIDICAYNQIEGFALSCCYNCHYGVCSYCFNAIGGKSDSCLRCCFCGCYSNIYCPYDGYNYWTVFRNYTYSCSCMKCGTPCGFVDFSCPRNDLDSFDQYNCPNFKPLTTTTCCDVLRCIQAYNYNQCFSGPYSNAIYCNGTDFVRKCCDTLYGTLYAYTDMYSQGDYNYAQWYTINPTMLYCTLKDDGYIKESTNDCNCLYWLQYTYDSCFILQCSPFNIRYLLCSCYPYMIGVNTNYCVKARMPWPALLTGKYSKRC